MELVLQRVPVPVPFRGQAEQGRMANHAGTAFTEQVAVRLFTITKLTFHGVLRWRNL
jgi:hypothetical protein